MSQFHVNHSSPAGFVMQLDVLQPNPCSATSAACTPGDAAKIIGQSPWLRGMRGHNAAEYGANFRQTPPALPGFLGTTSARVYSNPALHR